MKINAINNTTNFKGLFTDKTAQNGGNWRMEYSPYSWEKNNTSKMANKEKIDVFASTLPDNEEIYTRFSNGAENSKDILGTESYYLHSDGKMRRTITEVPAMNREESLRVQNRKLDAFLELKNQAFKNITSGMPDIPKEVKDEDARYRLYEEDIPVKLFSTSYERQVAMEKMHEAFDRTKGYAVNMYNKLINYDKIRKSADDVRNLQVKNSKEIALLENLRKNGQLIDISRRDIQEPNKALIENLTHCFNSIKSKFVCLPNKLLSMADIMRMLGRAAEIPENRQLIVNYINRLM